MGLLLSVLVGCVGAVELVSCLHYISDEWLLHQLRTQNKEALQAALSKYQDEIKNSLSQLERRNGDSNGEDYEDGYRMDNGEINEELRKKFQERLKEIIKSAGEDLSDLSDTSLSSNSAVSSIIDNEQSNSIKKELNENKFSNFNTDQDTVNDNLKNHLREVDQLMAAASSSDIQNSSFPDIHFNEYDRQSQVSDDYLRTLDGVKSRPLVRDDQRRRAFKKRNSGSSSSKDSKASREEELQIFTSLEEAEFESMKSDFVPITYSSEPNLKMKKQHRRHKKNSVPNMGITDVSEESELDRTTFDMLDEVGGEEVTHPWGDIKPDLRRDSDYWRRMKKESSIEEEDELEQAEHDIREHFSKYKIAQENEDSKSTKSSIYEQNETINVTDLIENATILTERAKTSSYNNIGRSDSFEDATNSQHDEALGKINHSNINETHNLNKKQNENWIKNKTNESNESTGATPKKNKKVSSSECDDPVDITALPAVETITNNFSLINNESSETQNSADNKYDTGEFSMRLQKIEKKIEQQISDWMGQADNEGISEDVKSAVEENITINDLMAHKEFVPDISMTENENIIHCGVEYSDEHNFEFNTKEFLDRDIKDIDDHDDKINEFQHYIDKLDKGKNVDDETYEHDKIEQLSSVNESDEEPFYGSDPKRTKNGKSDDSNTERGIVIDSSIVFDEYDVETNEDYSYLPELGTEDLFRLNSDEEPSFESDYNKIVDELNQSSDSIDDDVELKSKTKKRQKIRKHKKNTSIGDHPSESDDDSITDHNPSYRMPARHRRRGRCGGERPRDIIDMRDNVSDVNEGFSYLPNIGNEKDFVLDSDEEPYLRTLFMIDCIDGNEVEKLSQSSSSEYLLLQKIDGSDGEHKDNISTVKEIAKSTGAIPKSQVKKTFTQELIDFDNKYLAKELEIEYPHLGVVRQYTLDSDEEPYYSENKIIYDDGDSEDEDYISYLHRIYGEHHSDDEPCTRDYCRCRMFIEHERHMKEEREYDEERRMRLYDEYEIEQNVNYEFFSINLNEKHYTMDSDEEPNFYDESFNRNVQNEHKLDSFLTAMAKPDHYGIDSETGISSHNLIELESKEEQRDKNILYKSSLHIRPGVLNSGESSENSNDDESKVGSSITTVWRLPKKFVPRKESESEESDIDPFGFGKVTKRKLLDLEEDVDFDWKSEECSVGDSYNINKEKNIKSTKFEQETVVESSSFKQTKTNDYKMETSEQKVKKLTKDKPSIFQIKDETGDGPENFEEHMWESEPKDVSQISVLEKRNLQEPSFDWDDQNEEVANANEKLGDESGNYQRFDNTDNNCNKQDHTNGKTVSDHSDVPRNDSDNNLDWLDINEPNLRRAHSWGHEMVDLDEENVDSSFDWNDSASVEENFPAPSKKRSSISINRVPKVYGKMEELNDINDNNSSQNLHSNRRESDFEWKDESPFRIDSNSFPLQEFEKSLQTTDKNITKLTNKSQPIPVEEERELFESILNHRTKRQLSFTKLSSLEDSEIDDEHCIADEPSTSASALNNQTKNNISKKDKKKKKKNKDQKSNLPPQTTDPYYLLKESMYPFY